MIVQGQLILDPRGTGLDMWQQKKAMLPKGHYFQHQTMHFTNVRAHIHTHMGTQTYIHENAYTYTNIMFSFLSLFLSLSQMWHRTS